MTTDDGKPCQQGKCKGKVWYDRSCAAYVCDTCGAHHINYPSVGARCWCGWSASGGNGRRELIDMGECLDEDY